MSALERSGVADDTAVVFTTEHGDMLGDHGMLEKRSFYEESARVPLLMSVPWLSMGRVDGSVGQIDLAPTLLDLLGEPVPGRLEGRSLVPVLKGEETLAGNEVFMEWNGISPGLRDRFLGSEGDQPDAGAAVPVGGVGQVEAEPLRRRPGRALRPQGRPLRGGQPIRRPGAARPGPRHGRPHQDVAVRNR